MDPTRNGKGVLVRRPSHNQNSGRDYYHQEFSTSRNLDQPKSEDLVRKFCNSSIRDDTWIPVSLRVLERAQRKLQHDGLALAISAAEWMYSDLHIWQAYPADFARAEAWKHIKVGLDWLRYLRRKGEIRS